MSLRDISLWVRSARTDARLSRLRREHGAERAFELLYEQLEDPWACNVPHFRYQRLKYDTLLSLIPPRQYRSALDLGCPARGPVFRPGFDSRHSLILSAAAPDDGHGVTSPFCSGMLVGRCASRGVYAIL